MGERKHLIMPYYTLEEVANITGKSQRTIFRMLADGRITGEKDSDGKYIFRREPLEIFIAAQAGDKLAQAQQSLPMIRELCREQLEKTGCKGCIYCDKNGCKLRGTPAHWTV